MPVYSLLLAGVERGQNLEQDTWTVQQEFGRQLASVA
jgi:hypothetical protein